MVLTVPINDYVRQQFAIMSAKQQLLCCCSLRITQQASLIYYILGNGFKDDPSNNFKVRLDLQSKEKTEFMNYLRSNKTKHLIAKQNVDIR